LSNQIFEKLSATVQDARNSQAGILKFESHLADEEQTHLKNVSLLKIKNLLNEE
jgi:hypothetical protein